MAKLKYYVNINPQNNGDHEVHVPGCSHYPNVANVKYLGEFETCAEAVQEAKKTYPQSNGCYYCVKECHTS